MEVKVSADCKIITVVSDELDEGLTVVVVDLEGNNVNSNTSFSEGIYTSVFQSEEDNVFKLTYYPEELTAEELTEYIVLINCRAIRCQNNKNKKDVDMFLKIGKPTSTSDILSALNRVIIANVKLKKLTLAKEGLEYVQYNCDDCQC